MNLSSNVRVELRALKAGEPLLEFTIADAEGNSFSFKVCGSCCLLLLSHLPCALWVAPAAASAKHCG